MPLATFDFAILNDVSSEPEQRAIITQYGDGYEQTTEAGINTEVDRITLQCSFSAAQAGENNRLRAFLALHGSYKSFVYQKPWESVVKQWRIESWSQRSRRSKPSYTHDYTLKLKQVFDP
jgi:phage-related protein